MLMTCQFIRRLRVKNLDDCGAWFIKQGSLPTDWCYQVSRGDGTSQIYRTWQEIPENERLYHRDGWK